MFSICKRCNKEFKHSPADARFYCNETCYRPPIFHFCLICNKKFRVKPSAIKRNNGGGKFCSLKCLYIHRGREVGENANAYKGDKAKYSACHMWIRTNFEKKEECSSCKAKNRWLEWANISGEYKRERSDWLILCVPCHRRFDNQLGRQNLSLRFRSKLL